MGAKEEPVLISGRGMRFLLSASNMPPQINCYVNQRITMGHGYDAPKINDHVSSNSFPGDKAAQMNPQS